MNNEQFNIVDTDIRRYDNEQENTTIYLVNFTDDNVEEVNRISYAINNDLGEEDAIGDDLYNSLEYRFKNNIWSGLTLPFHNTVDNKIVAVILLNHKKFIRLSKERGYGDPKWFMNGILSHEIRHLVDFISISLKNGMPTDIEEYPALLQGYFLQDMAPAAFQYLESVLQSQTLT